MKVSQLIAYALLGAVFISTALFAHNKTDLITLENGNTLNGEIKGLLRGKLSYGTDSMGTVQVEWDDIAAVNSEYHYEIRLQNGERHYGSLVFAASHRKVGIRQKSGELVVPIIDIVELRPIEDSLEERVNMRIGAGYSYQKSSKIASFSINSDFSYQDEKGETGMSGRSTRTDNDGETDQSNRYRISREMWTRRPGLVRWFDGSYEDNDEMNLDYRFTTGFGLGRAIVDTNRQSLVGYLGLQAVTEREGGDNTVHSAEGVLGTSYDLWQFDTPEVDLQFELTLYPGLTESGRLRGDSNVLLSWELVEDFFFDITAWVSYDSDVSIGASTDYGVTSGVSWEY